jgi:uncharacterized membrane protein
MPLERTVEEKVFAILSYMQLLVIIPLVLKKDNDFVHFHTKQGLVLLLAWLVGMALGMLDFLVWPSIVLMLFLVGVPVAAIVQVLKGKKWEIPVVSGIADRLNF